jgi:TRAP-type uncharacterized transport system fused permease subunit
MAASVQGWFLVKLYLIERVALGAVVFLLFIPDMTANMSGLGVLILVVIWQIIRRRSIKTNMHNLSKKVDKK